VAYNKPLKSKKKNDTEKYHKAAKDIIEPLTRNIRQKRKDQTNEEIKSFQDALDKDPTLLTRAKAAVQKW
jgi:IMP dehydrogenase/GMP reductase